MIKCDLPSATTNLEATLNAQHQGGQHEVIVQTHMADKYRAAIQPEWDRYQREEEEHSDSDKYW
jgi:hypothetical protein